MITFNLKALISIIMAVAVWFIFNALGIIGEVDDSASTLLIGIIVTVMDLIFVAASDESKGGIVGIFPLWFIGIVTALYSAFVLFGFLYCMGAIVILVVLFAILAVIGNKYGDSSDTDEDDEDGENEGKSDSSGDAENEGTGENKTDAMKGESDTSEAAFREGASTTGTSDQDIAPPSPAPEATPSKPTPSVPDIPGTTHETAVEQNRPVRKVKKVRKRASGNATTPVAYGSRTCRQCGNTIPITTTERPLVVTCSSCGKKYKLNT